MGYWRAFACTSPTKHQNQPNSFILIASKVQIQLFQHIKIVKISNRVFPGYLIVSLINYQFFWASIPWRYLSYYIIQAIQVLFSNPSLLAKNSTKVINYTGISSSSHRISIKYVRWKLFEGYFTYHHIIPFV